MTTTPARLSSLLRQLILRLPVLLFLCAISGTLSAQDQAGWLGVFLGPERAAVVAEVVPGSPAARVGLRAGDTVLAIDDAVTANPAALAQAIAATRPGQQIELKLRRGDREQVVTVQLARRPGDQQAPAPPSSVGGGERPPSPVVEGGGEPDQAVELRSLPPARHGLVVNLQPDGSLMVVRRLGIMLPPPGALVLNLNGAEVRGHSGLIALQCALRDDSLQLTWRAPGAAPGSEPYGSQSRASGLADLWAAAAPLGLGRSLDVRPERGAADVQRSVVPSVADVGDWYVERFGPEEPGAGARRAARRGRRLLEIWVRPDDSGTELLGRLAGPACERVMAGLTVTRIDPEFLAGAAAQRGGVVALPHLLVRDGRGVLERLEGLPEREELREFLGRHSWRSGDWSEPRGSETRGAEQHR